VFNRSAVFVVLRAKIGLRVIQTHADYKFVNSVLTGTCPLSGSDCKLCRA